MDNRGKASANNRQAPCAELPQWNSKFRFSAQKGASGKTKDHPKEHSQLEYSQQKHLASGAQRVPVGGQACQESKTCVQDMIPHADAVTPIDSNKTPTACLFQKFENLTLTTPAASKNGSRSGAGISSHDVVAASTTAAARTGAHAGRNQRRSVAFGTPSVLTYTPAAPIDTAAQQGSTPLWSNAGHTPYSLTGKSSGICIQAVGEAGEERSLIGSRSEVRMEYFSSLIGEHEVQQTPVASTAAPRTPATESLAASAAGAALQSDADHVDECAGENCSDSEEQDIMLTPLAGARVAADSNNSSFTGFGPEVVNGMDAEEESTPPFFGRTGDSSAATQAAVYSSCNIEARAPDSAAEVTKRNTPTAAAIAAADSSGTPGAADTYCFTSKLATPKSRLRQPARVPVGGSSKPMIPLELKQLLNDPHAAAAVDPAANLGTCEVLSPVRPRKQLQQAMGAADQVLSPVRRSARKAAKQLLAPGASAVIPMLEATNYCYQGRGDNQPTPYDGSSSAV